MNRTKIVMAIVLACLAFGLLGARRGNRAPVEIGHSYTVQTYPTAIEGKVTDVLGNGWWTIQKNDGSEVDVNIMAAYSVIEKR